MKGTLKMLNKVRQAEVQLSSFCHSDSEKQGCELHW